MQFMRDTKITNVNLVKNHLLHSAQKKHIHEACKNYIKNTPKILKKNR